MIYSTNLEIVKDKWKNTGQISLKLGSLNFQSIKKITPNYGKPYTGTLRNITTKWKCGDALLFVDGKKYEKIILS
tara:strand:+ start:220 stop:444 length:225 start_codon:yes stop_codon:yes gene_type:complete